MLQGDVKDGNVLFFPTPYRHFTGHQVRRFWLKMRRLPANLGEFVEILTEKLAF